MNLLRKKLHYFSDHPKYQRVEELQLIPLHVVIDDNDIEKKHPVKELPSHVLIDILCRVPSKHINRCKCVSKYWNALISSQYFMTLYDRRQSALNGSYEDGTLIHIINKDCLISFDLHTHVRQDLTQYVPDELQIALKNGNFIGSCNGLLCFQYDMSYPRVEFLWIYNPTTGACKFASNLIDGSRSRYTPTTFAISGFGYDCVSDDYKVVTILLNWSHDENNETYVYNLRTNLWKRITNHRTRRCYYSYHRCGVVAANTLHWLTVVGRYGSMKLSIKRFNLATEQFGCMETPDEIEPYHQHPCYHSNSQLATLKGCLHILHVLKPETNSTEWEISIWIMKEYGVHESWAKIFNYKWSDNERIQAILDLSEQYFASLTCAYTKDEREIIVIPQSFSGTLLLCNLESQKIETVYLQEAFGYERSDVNRCTTMAWSSSLLNPNEYCTSVHLLKDYKSIQVEKMELPRSNNLSSVVAVICLSLYFILVIALFNSLSSS